MAKSKSAKRKQSAQVDSARKIAKTTPGAIITPPPDAGDVEPKTLHTVISDEELEVTIDTLRTLAEHPGLIKTKACKDLRVAAYDFRQACTTGSINAAGSNLSARISATLADENYVEARVLLAEMRIRGQEPKLGTLCRWVRDLDCLSGLSQTEGDTSNKEKYAKNKLLLGVLDAVLRVCGQIDESTTAVCDASSLYFPMNLQPVWDMRPSTIPEQVYASVLDKSIFDAAPKNLSSSLRVIETTPAHLRKPPNQFPAILYTSAPNSIPLSATAPHITWHDHPSVPRLGMAKNVLSSEECKAIIAAGEHVNFLPDAPIREDGDLSILAHNFYWVVDTAFHDTLWSRVSPFLPRAVNGRLARGLNRRFRVYRYVPGAEYRCHIDGAWPPSGILPDDTYVYDASPEDKKQSSLFTFLMYLNDEFEGGETTFFLPAAREGLLNAYPVRPVMGAVAVFPHGDTNGALLHEGTGVRRGAKYIIRTDVEYDVKPTEGA
ncbi:hypothetical protein S7711_01687 [Stachybotrys chartarum IBT 7711]|uniref:Fe2OG dioxygenase domain-containing protein n=1 Tax=Stachybotrys chartarum (strain CBS 109288 / IBT 7711) TaxID=1280523 RepID=A0A084AVA3_STACB|nr:hypothetical protein S7711_01687 [Stachybotrys chartarum IBT 7711]